MGGSAAPRAVVCGLGLLRSVFWRAPLQAAVTGPLAPRTRLLPGAVSALGLRDLQAQHGAGGVGVPEPKPAGCRLGGGAALRRRD